MVTFYRFPYIIYVILVNLYLIITNTIDVIFILIGEYFFILDSENFLILYFPNYILI